MDNDLQEDLAKHLAAFYKKDWSHLAVRMSYRSEAKQTLQVVGPNLVNHVVWRRMDEELQQRLATHWGVGD